jgi:hypothetical protein
VIEHPVEAPDIGASDDRVPRTESYVRDFASLPVGERRIYLPQGRQRLTLTAPEIPQSGVIDLRMLVLRRQSSSLPE